MYPFTTQQLVIYGLATTALTGFLLGYVAGRFTNGKG